MLRDAVVDIGLVYYLGNQPREVIDQGGLGGRNFGTVDGICGAILDQEGEKGEDAANEKGNDEGVDDEKNGESATHVCF